MNKKWLKAIQFSPYQMQVASLTYEGAAILGWWDGKDTTTFGFTTVPTNVAATEQPTNEMFLAGLLESANHLVDNFDLAVLKGMKPFKFGGLVSEKELKKLYAS